MRKVFDSSAVLAFLYNEPGADKVRSDLPDGVISAVNAMETLQVLTRNGVSLSDAKLSLTKTGLRILDFNLGHASTAAALFSPQLPPKGISLADRACIAVAVHEKLPVVTADRPWCDLSLPGLQLEMIR